jgi:chromosome segregation ATPase
MLNPYETVYELVKQRQIALLEGMNSMGWRLDGLESKLDGFKSKLDGLESRLDGLESKLDGLESGLDGLESHLNSIIMTIYGWNSASCLNSSRQKQTALYDPDCAESKFK